MNGSIRVSAKTVDDAITEALIQLGVTSDRLEYEVIEKGSAGFLGIGMKQAVIEARRKPEPKEEKVEEPVVEEPVKAEPKKVETVQPQKAAAEKKADEPQKAAFEKGQPFFVVSSQVGFSFPEQGGISGPDSPNTLCRML